MPDIGIGTVISGAALISGGGFFGYLLKGITAKMSILDSKVEGIAHAIAMSTQNIDRDRLEAVGPAKEFKDALLHLVRTVDRLASIIEKQNGGRT